MSGTTWMILNRSQDRVLHRTSSTLDAFRTARRRVGGTARLERAGTFKVAVVGKTDTINLVRLAAIKVEPAPIVQPVAAIEVEEPVRVAIHVDLGPKPETVRLPGGFTFTWIPADAPWPTAEVMMGRGGSVP